MNRGRTRRTETFWLQALAALVLLGLPRPGDAKFNVRLDAAGADRDGVRIAAGETLKQDVVTSGPISIAGTLDGDCVSLGGPIDVRGKVLGSLASLGGPTDISGTVAGDVASLGGAVKITGTIGGDVTSLGGEVTLGDRASVAGDVALLGGRLDRAGTGVVRGNVVRRDWKMMGRFAPLLARYGRTEEPEAVGKISVFYRIVRCAALLAFFAGIGLMAVLMTALLPRQVESVAAAVRRDFWKSAAIGALILVLLVPGLLLMLISILGIPLVPMAILLACAAVLMSVAAFSLILTQRLCDARQRDNPGVLAGVGVGYLMLSGLMIVGKLMKVAGGVGAALGGIFVLADVMLLSCAVVVGLGAVWTTRMGSRPEGGRP